MPNQECSQVSPMPSESRDTNGYSLEPASLTNRLRFRLDEMAGITVSALDACAGIPTLLIFSSCVLRSLRKTRETIQTLWCSYAAAVQAYALFSAPLLSASTAGIHAVCTSTAMVHCTLGASGFRAVDAQAVHPTLDFRGAQTLGVHRVGASGCVTLLILTGTSCGSGLGVQHHRRGFLVTYNYTEDRRDNPVNEGVSNENIQHHRHTRLSCHALLSSDSYGSGACRRRATPSLLLSIRY